MTTRARLADRMNEQKTHLQTSVAHSSGKTPPDTRDTKVSVGKDAIALIAKLADKDACAFCGVDENAEHAFTCEARAIVERWRAT